jgi:hypothetical protein
VRLTCGGLFGDCHGRDCSEVSGLMGVWGLPISLPVSLVFYALPIEGCTIAAFIVGALAFCGAGLIQWYFIMRRAEMLLTKLYRLLRPHGGGATR